MCGSRRRSEVSAGCPQGRSWQPCSLTYHSRRDYSPAQRTRGNTSSPRSWMRSIHWSNCVLRSNTK